MCPELSIVHSGLNGCLDVKDAIDKIARYTYMRD